jgi:hypothetical protein
MTCHYHNTSDYAIEYERISIAVERYWMKRAALSGFALEESAHAA